MPDELLEAIRKRAFHLRTSSQAARHADAVASKDAAATKCKQVGRAAGRSSAADVIPMAAAAAPRASAVACSNGSKPATGVTIAPSGNSQTQQQLMLQKALDMRRSLIMSGGESDKESDGGWD